MKHCVATYIRACARRRTSIWSMKMQQGERRIRTLTIEVLPNSRIIWQAKGKRNASPEGVAEEMLHQWAGRKDCLSETQRKRVNHTASCVSDLQLKTASF